MLKNLKLEEDWEEKLECLLKRLEGEDEVFLEATGLRGEVDQIEEIIRKRLKGLRRGK